MTMGPGPRPRSARTAPPPGNRTGWWRGPNLPYLAAIVLSAVVLVLFMVLARPFATSGDTAAAPTTAATPTTGGGSGETSTTTTTGTTTTLPGDMGTLQGLDLELVTSRVAFPVYAVAIPGDDRIFVLERGGQIRVIDPTANPLPTPFLDLTDRVGSAGIENGLLGMAFHPDFDDNGRFFVYYTDTDLNSRLSEFRGGSRTDPVADRDSERILLEVQQSGIRHRAGMLQFGPEGYLYVALGDGGLGDASAQDLTIYQGKILRIDVDGGDPYAIPADNPYAGGGGLGEIWAHGLRNPWRFHIDGDGGLIYIGDVGQSNWEEINVQPITAAGLDYGWPNFEGTDCYKPSDGCDMLGWQEPTLVYSHEEGCSVTGGFVYRGTAIPELNGHYFYADWCNGWIRSFRYAEGQVVDEQDWSADLEGAGQVSSFGLDGDGELLVVDSNGSVFRVVPVRANEP